MGSREDDLARLLGELQRADDAGDRAAFRALEITISRHLVRRRAANESLRIAELDFALLDRLSADILDELPSAALELSKESSNTRTWSFASVVVSAANSACGM